MSHLSTKTASVVRDIDCTDQLIWVRVKSVKQEVTVGEYLIVILMFFSSDCGCA